MSKNYTGAKRKRTNTPAMNRKRAVEFRHRAYAPKKTEIELPVPEPVILPETEQEPAVQDGIEEVISEEIIPAEKPAETENGESSETAAPDLANAAAGAAAAGFFAKIGNAFRGLFSRSKPAGDEQHNGVVSDLKTWISSPIDPDDESEEITETETEETPAETAAEQEVQAETDTGLIPDEPEEFFEGEEMLSDDSEPVAETEEEEASAAEEETESAEKELSEPEALTADTEEESAEKELSEEALSEETETAEESAAEEAELQSETEETETPSEETAEETAESEEETEILSEEADEEPAEEEPERIEETAEAKTEEETETPSDETDGESAEEAEISEPESEEPVAETEDEPVQEEAGEETLSAETETEEPVTEEPEELSETEDEEILPEEPAEETAETEPVEAQTEEEAEPEEAPLTRKEKRQLKKEIKKETKLQLIDEIIDSPRAGLFTMMLAPGLAMKRVSTVEKTTLAAPSVFILNFFKWAAVGTFFAMFIEKFINHFNYSFIRMNFTGTATMAFRFGIFGLIAEYLCWMIIGLFCGLIRKKISTFKLMEVVARSAPGITLLFVIACVLIWKDMFAYGTAIGLCAAVIGLLTKGYGMDLVLPIGKNTQLVLVILLVLASTFAASKYFPLTVSGLMDIFRTILNL